MQTTKIGYIFWLGENWLYGKNKEMDAKSDKEYDLEPTLSKRVYLVNPPNHPLLKKNLHL